MFIRVTNSFPDRKGDVLIININVITSVFEEHVDGGSLSTVIYSTPNLVWHVEESIGEVEKKIKEAMK
jgi:hypothetical protein